MPKHSQRKAMNKWAEEKHKLDAAREQRDMHIIPDDDPDYAEIMKNARRELEIRRASAISCKVTKPGNPNGSGWRRPYACAGSKIETKRLKFSCSKQEIMRT